MRRHAKALVAALTLLGSLVLGVALAAGDPPTVSIDPVGPGAATFNSAHVSGAVNPEDNETSYSFEYAIDPGTEGWSSTGSLGSIAAGAGSTPVEADLGGLKPGSEYRLRLVANNSLDPEVVSTEETFETDAVNPPEAHDLLVTGVTADSAHFEGVVNAGGSGAGEAAGTYRFQCQPECLGIEGEKPIPGAGSDETVAADATGLEPDTAYTVMLITRNPRTDAEGQPVIDSAEPFTTPAAVPGVLAGTNTPESETSVFLRGAVNPHHSPVTDCHFEYGPTAAYGQSTPCSPAHPGIDEIQSIRVRAGAGQFRLSFDGQTTPDIAFDAPAPVVEAALRALSSIGSPNVTVSGGPGNPLGRPTYVVTFAGALAATDVEQMGIEDGTIPLSGGDEGFTVAEVSTGVQGGLDRPVEVTARLTGLTPGTAGHFKLVATSAVGTGESLDAPFVTFSAPAPEEACANQARRDEQDAAVLGECRAWEMTSPPNKNGGDVTIEVQQTRAADDGDAAVFNSLAAFGDVKGTGVASTYLARRTATPGTQGWATHSIMPSGLEPSPFVQLSKNPRYRDFSADLSKGVFLSPTPLTADPATEKITSLYLREDLLSPRGGSNRLLTHCPLCAEPGEDALSDPKGFSRPELAAATPDFDQVLFELDRNLTADAPPYPPFPQSFCNENPFLSFAGCRPRLYENDHGVVRLVGRIPPSGQTECDDSGGVACQGAPESIAGVGARTGRYTFNTISADGSKAFFTVPTSGGEEGNLYLRIDHTTTVQINASERSVPAEPKPAKFGVISNNSTVFFATSEQLTEEPCSGLYAYDSSKPASDPHNLTCVYTDQRPEDSGDLEGVIGASSDGSYLYFSARGAILRGQGPAPNSQVASGIYLWHEGKISFVGWTDAGSASLVNNLTGSSASIQQLFSARVAPDGRSLLFHSLAGEGLTGYDHGDTCSAFAINNNGPCSELYLYRAESNSLSCATCDPSVAVATSDAGFSARVNAGSSSGTPGLNRSLSADGRWVLFDSAERFVPADTNGVRDVYRYETETGRYRLISSGTASSPSFFLDASPDGDDVFFDTAQQVVGWDTDGNYDLYDARVGGGFPEPAPVPAPCTGESCRTPVQPPAGQVAGSAAFQGPVNPRCARRAQRPRGKGHRKASRCRPFHGKRSPVKAKGSK